MVGFSLTCGDQKDGSFGGGSGEGSLQYLERQFLDEHDGYERLPGSSAQVDDRVLAQSVLQELHLVWSGLYGGGGGGRSSLFHYSLPFSFVVVATRGFAPHRRLL